VRTQAACAAEMAIPMLKVGWPVLMRAEQQAASIGCRELERDQGWRDLAERFATGIELVPARGHGSSGRPELSCQESLIGWDS
jgi:hypothetical protein